MNSRLGPLVLSAVVFSISFLYFYQTSQLLPIGAAPDYPAHDDAVDFIYRNSRLAVLPADQDTLHYTMYGSTRVLRPPLSYIVSAAVAKSIPGSNENLRLAYRKGSALLCALTVTLIFYSLRMFFDSTGIGLTAALLIALMPQFTFIASYNNDDSAAIFSTTLMFTILLSIYKRGPSLLRTVLFGLSCGLLVLAKPTAWLLFPTVVLFALVFIRVPMVRLVPYATTVMVTAVIAGGWWLAFNMYHYGVEDPFARKIAMTHAEQHRRLKPNAVRSYKDEGVSYYQLVVKNHKNFWGATAKSAIGKLDWLRLGVGNFAYALYFTVFFVGLLYYPLRAITLGLQHNAHGPGDIVDKRQFALESVMVFAIVFQIAMYVWRNMNTEIQLQGKYIIPISFAVLFLFFAAMKKLANKITYVLNERGIYSIPITDINRAGLLMLVGLVVLAHINVWMNHVIPFYRPPLQDFSISSFRALDITDTGVIQMDDVSRLNIHAGTLEIEISGRDPRLVLDPMYCDPLQGNVLLRIVIDSDEPGLFQVFIDQGDGFNEDDSYHARYDKGSTEIHMAMANGQCHQVRLDPGTRPGHVTIKAISVARVRIRPLP